MELDVGDRGVDVGIFPHLLNKKIDQFPGLPDSILLLDDTFGKVANLLCFILVDRFTIHSNSP